MPTELRYYGQTPVQVRTSNYSAPYVSLPNRDFELPSRTVDSDVAAAFQTHQAEALPAHPTEFYRHPTVFFSNSRATQEQSYRDTLSSLMANASDRDAILQREDCYQQLRTASTIYHRKLRGIMNAHSLRSLVGLIAILPERNYPWNIGLGIAFESINNLQLAVRLHVPYLSPRPDIPFDFVGIARAARDAREQNAPQIVQKWGEHGHEYLNEATRVADNSTLLYLDSLQGIRGTPSTMLALQRTSGITTASVELELARIAETRITDPHCRFA